MSLAHHRPPLAGHANRVDWSEGHSPLVSYLFVRFVGGSVGWVGLGWEEVDTRKEREERQGYVCKNENEKKRLRAVSGD